jgi:predicted DNA-binding protein (MmcQ/YjbR family)
MVSVDSMRKLALSCPGAEEKPHFEKTSWRVKGRIFATLDTKNNRACLKLSPAQQSAFSAYNRKAIHPVPNAWGKQGWTFVELPLVRKDMFKAALTVAYSEVSASIGSEKRGRRK